jgi:hypothetical protein
MKTLGRQTSVLKLNQQGPFEMFLFRDWWPDLCELCGEKVRSSGEKLAQLDEGGAQRQQILARPGSRPPLSSALPAHHHPGLLHLKLPI